MHVHVCILYLLIIITEMCSVIKQQQHIKRQTYEHTLNTMGY